MSKILIIISKISSAIRGFVSDSRLVAVWIDLPGVADLVRSDYAPYCDVANTEATLAQVRHQISVLCKDQPLHYVKWGSPFKIKWPITVLRVSQFNFGIWTVVQIQ